MCFNFQKQIFHAYLGREHTNAFAVLRPDLTPDAVFVKISGQMNNRTYHSNIFRLLTCSVLTGILNNSVVFIFDS